ncbi:rRNA (cytosine-C5-)-methyltransferase nop2 [Arachnomyces sp. PD_36]|nr:rRNA (cytosine-C5-)-methyltransferase nop2 [Arachnomyces sp. PD_36]
MGVGRRMKKQGPPQPLDESKFSSQKKRKATETEDTTTSSGKKRRRSGGKEEVSVKPKDKKKKVNGSAKEEGRNGVQKKELGGGRSNGVKKSKKAVEVVEKEGEDATMEDLLGDEFEGLDDVSEGSISGLGEGDSELEDDEFDDDSAFDSEEEGHARGEKMFSDDEDDSEAEERLTAANIEGLSRKLDQEQEEEAAEAELELKEAALQTNIAGDGPDVDASASTPGLAPDLQLLRTRITDTIRILGDLSTLGNPDKSRADYTDLLINDICTYYGYTPFLAEKLFSLFTPLEAFAFFEANESPRPVVIRTNTLITNRRSLAQALINRGVVLEPVGKWSKVGLQVFESAVPLGATPEYLAGHYILQAASSFLPVMALAPQPNERVLDMAAAPGGKTTYISALMRNTGSVLANDANKARAKGLIGNIHRLGCKNTIVSNLDARTGFPKVLGGFDRVLLDAPCSGTGVISKDPSVKTSKTERDFLALPHMQKQLLLAAIDSTDHNSKTGGYIVYSTCSVTVEENEGVVQYALRTRPNVKLVDTGLGSFGSEGFKSYIGKRFDDKMALTRRYFPHRENVDGFFVAKFKKTGPSPKGGSATSTSAKNGEKSKPTDAGAGAESEDEPVNKAPITDETTSEAEKTEDSFGPFNEDEDETYIARAERNRVRRKGLDPKGVVPKERKEKSKSKKKGSGGGESNVEKVEGLDAKSKKEIRRERKIAAEKEKKKEKKQKK